MDRRYKRGCRWTAGAPPVWEATLARYHPPLEGGSKNSEVRERQRTNTKYFSGRGDVDGALRPEILFSLSLKDNFDPPSSGGWNALCSVSPLLSRLFNRGTRSTLRSVGSKVAPVIFLINRSARWSGRFVSKVPLLIISCLTGERIERGSIELRCARVPHDAANDRRIPGGVTGEVSGKKQAPVLPDMLAKSGAIVGFFYPSRVDQKNFALTRSRDCR
jgi:hypothetical protein